MEPTAVEPPRDGTHVAGRLLAWTTAADTAVVVATGVWLYRYYTPTVAAGNPIGASHVLPTDWFRLAHRWSALLLIGLSAVWVLLAVVRLVRRATASTAIGVGLSLVAAVTLGAAWFTGWLLPWDQLALWAVKVDQDMRGYRFLWRNDVRFVILGHREIGLELLQREFLVHAVALPIVLVLIVLAAVWVLRRRAVKPPPSPDGRSDAATVADAGRAPFQFTVTGVFTLTGHGLVAAGVVDQGEVRAGEVVEVHHDGSTHRAICGGIEALRMPEPVDSGRVGLLLPDLTVEQVAEGDTIVMAPTAPD